jgi:hypothetical protein
MFKWMFKAHFRWGVQFWNQFGIDLKQIESLSWTIIIIIIIIPWSLGLILGSPNKELSL